MPNEKVLGPWCLSDDDRGGLERLIDTYSDPWDDAELVCRETQKVRLIVNTLIHEYTRILTKRHHLVDHQVFFEKLLLNWLGPIVAFTHERRLQIEHFINMSKTNRYKTIGLKVNRIELYTTGCSSAIFHQDEMSQYISTQLLSNLKPECVWFEKIQTLEQIQSEFSVARKDKKPLNKLMNSLKFGFTINPIYPLSRYKSLLHSFALSTLNKLLLFDVPDEHEVITTHRENCERDGLIEDVTYQVAKNVAAISLPNSLSGDFALRFERAKIKASKEKTEVFVQYPDAHDEDRLFLNSLRQKLGKKVYYQQHGCSYDSNPIYNHFHELEQKSSGFISWGWERAPQFTRNVIPLPMPAVRKAKCKNADMIYVTKGSRMQKNLFVGDLRPVRYSLLDDLNRTRFLSELKPELRHDIRIRPQQTNYDISVGGNYVRNKLARDVIIGKTRNFHKLMRDSQAILSDHYGTTFYLCMAMNIPYLAHWNSFPILKFYNQGIFGQLKDLGIIHDSPVKAARFINETSSLQDWWLTGEVQQIRERFCDEYFLTSHTCFQDWFQFLNSGLNK